MGDAPGSRARFTSSSTVVADCETYIRGHHQWLVRTAKAVGSAYALGPDAHEQLLAELYEVLFRRWGQDLLGAGEHARNGYAHKLLIYRAQVHRTALDLDLGPLCVDGTDAETLRSILLNRLTGEERDVIVMMYGLKKDETQVAAELGLPHRSVSRVLESAVDKLRTGLRPLVRDGAGRGVRG
jgi:DNA-directed RNA polymerase specialized sigma24 family protein